MFESKTLPRIICPIPFATHHASAGHRRRFLQAILSAALVQALTLITKICIWITFSQESSKDEIRTSLSRHRSDILDTEEPGRESQRDIFRLSWMILLQSVQLDRVWTVREGYLEKP